jgi:UDP-N-acetyl-D-galactosamine dehydrogenase
VKDFRNTPVVELNNKLITYGANVVVYDPLASPEDLEHLGLKPAPSDVLGYENSFDCLILAVPHKDLAQMTYKQYVSLLNTHNAAGIILDIKGVLKPDSRDDIIYWRL